MIGLLLTTAAFAPQAGLQELEARYYDVDYLTPPDGEILEVGGMDFLPDGRLAISTRRGQVWLVENPLAEDPADARFTLFAEGLFEGLGLKVVDGDVYVMQRGELSRLRDADGDGVCDHVDTISAGWGVSGNYHEFGYGLPTDADGNFFVSLNVAFFSPKWWHGKSPVPYRGWVMKVSPDGTATPFAHGFRSPCGLDVNAAGDLFVTDNQGDWMAVSPIFHVREGGFYGHPASLQWTPEYQASRTEPSDTAPPAAAAHREPAAMWLPYKWSRSPGNLVEDTSGGRFGPFGGQQILAELTNGMLVRVMLEKVQGEYQGAAIPFRQKIGSACRVRFADDGTLFVGMTNRGWGGYPPASGIARVRWTGETPFEIDRVRLVDGGFEVSFTQPLGQVTAVMPEAVRVQQYDYDYWWEYGSPVRNVVERNVGSMAVSADKRTLTLKIDDLKPAMMASLELFGIESESGDPLLHPEVHYTVNQLASGPRTDAHVVKVVPPPPARESGEQGWLRLTFGDATDGWNAEGWELVDAEVDPDQPTRLMTQKGVNAVCNTASPAPTDYVSKQGIGDAKLHLEFMLPESGNSGVVLMGRYELDLRDSVSAQELTPAHCGGLPPMNGAGEGTPPRFHAYDGAGRWHDLDVEFQAPRFDELGNKTENARLVWVKLNDTLLHENVELLGPTAGYEGPEAAFGPLVLQGTGTHAAFGNVRVFPRIDAGEEIAEQGWTPLWTEDDEDLDALGWTTTGDARWTLADGVLTGEGPMGHLFSPRGDYRDFELRARVKISEGGNSGLYFRVQPTDGWPAGYEAQINSSYADPQKTGSLYGLAPVKTGLVSPDTWFDYDVTCREDSGGTRVVIKVNGVVFTDFLDTEERHGPGHVAIQQHNDGSVVEVKDLRVREL